jgi:hypothetical protein
MFDEISLVLRTFRGCRDVSKGLGPKQRAFYKLSSFGARRGKSFLNDDSRSSKPSFGLCDLRTFLHLVNGPEARAKFLRNISKSFPLQPNGIFIRYQNMNREYPVPAYVSDLPHQFETLKRSLDGTPRFIERHIRWTHHPAERESSHHDDGSTKLVQPEARRHEQQRRSRSKSPKNDPYQHHIKELRLTKERCYLLPHDSIRESDEFTLAWREYGKECYVLDESEEPVNDMDEECVYPGAYEGDEFNVMEFEFLMGDFDLATIFLRKGSTLDRYKAYGYGSHATTDELVAALDDMLVDPMRFNKYLDTWGVANTGDD